MRHLLLLVLAAQLFAAEATAPVPALSAPVPASSPIAVNDAIVMLGKLPDPLVERQLADFFAGASSQDAGQALMHIAIAAVRPARVVVVPMLTHRDPLVVDRALRALSVLGVDSSALREQVERILADAPPAVAAQAAACLGAGDDRRAVPALVARISQGPPEVAGAALMALQRLTQVDFKTDVVAWDAWYQAERQQSVKRLAEQVEELAKPDERRRIAAIAAIGAMRSDRLEAVDLLLPLLEEEPAVAMAARQALAALSPWEFAMPTTAEILASRAPAPLPVQAKANGVITYLANQGLFDTWYGLLLTTFIGILVLSGALFVLRSGPVKNVTRRIGRVVVAGTMRLSRPVLQVSERIQMGTKRIIKTFAPGPAKGPAVARAKGELSSKSRAALDADRINHLKKNRIGSTPPRGNPTGDAQDQAH